MHSTYADLANAAWDMFSIIPHGVGVDASFSLGLDVIGWGQSKTNSKTVQEKFVIGLFARGNPGTLMSECAPMVAAATENDLELKHGREKWQLHRMANVQDFLEMWQGSQKICAAQKESHPHMKQMTAVGYISDTKDIIEAFWSHFQHACVVAFKLFQRSHLPPALSAQDLPGGQIQGSNVCWIRRIGYHPVKIDGDSAPEIISDTENWLNLNGDLNFQNKNNDNSECDDESQVHLSNCFKASDIREHRMVCLAPHCPGCIWPTWTSMKQAEKGLMTDSAMETMRNKGNKNK